MRCNECAEPTLHHRPAGADIKEMKDKSCDVQFSPSLRHAHIDPFPVEEAYTSNFIANWNVVSKLNKPIIAAVSGYAVCVHIPPDHLTLTIVARWRS
jgi:hypothetical protein